VIQIIEVVTQIIIQLQHIQAQRQPVMKTLHQIIITQLPAHHIQNQLLQIVNTKGII
jgi:hypothetical protein